MPGKGGGSGALPRYYRGDVKLAPQGVYASLGSVGGLTPYAASTEDLVSTQFARLHAWLGVLDVAGVDRELFFEDGGGLLSSSS